MLDLDSPFHFTDVSCSPKRRATVTIISDDNALKNVTNVRKLMGNYLRSMKLERTSWKEQVHLFGLSSPSLQIFQILNAVSVNGGDVVNATVCDAIKHCESLPF